MIRFIDVNTGDVYNGSAPYVEIDGKIYDGVNQDLFCKLLAEAVKNA